ncbi:aminotransferase [Enterococcus faecalis]|uniref:Aminotransferase n=1 Tax=Pisciglobus halotolerans TaxID=745365 RepID=A0A1I3E295_9LACT|nr:aminotransferase [Pisciglobus halotolerans]SFH92958.1 Aspartate/methionine/tyrosine aminotransferase [Pisciglobus halotolerans]
MDIANFGVEEWLNEWETKATYDLAQSTVSSMTLSEAISIDGTNPDDFFRSLYDTKMNYGYIEGSPAFKEEVAKMYQNVESNNILQTNGATGANLLALYALIKPGDHVVSMFPTYQQLYDIPRSFGAEVDFVYLNEEDGWRFPIEDLEKVIRSNTKMITLNSANNPTGTLIKEEDLRQIVKLAEKVGAYILVDEVYAPFSNPNSVSVVDLYDKGISTNSLSKTFSIPGIRIGWTATSKELADLFRKYRDYTMICSGIIDDALAVHVLKNRDKILKRNYNLLSGNLKKLQEWVESEELVSLVYPEYVSTSFVKFNVPVPIKEFCIELLKKEGVLLVPGSSYEIEGHVRLGYCCSSEVLEEGLKRISRFLNQYR